MIRQGYNVFAMEKYTAAVVQMNSQPDFERNLEQAYSLIGVAAGGGARLVGLPENFAFLGDFNVRLDEAANIAERTPDFLKETAAEFAIYLLGGSFPVPDGKGKVYNRSLLFGPDGSRLATYDKIHLFDVDLPEGESYRESDYVRSGENNAVVFGTDEIGRAGMTICYDLRFPEQYRRLMDERADLLCVPAAFTATTGKDHWKPLLQARAIENTAYVFAPAQTGVHGEKRRTHGHSMIIDPWGTVLADAGTDPGVSYAEIHPDRLREVRQRIPSLEHRVVDS